VAATQRRHRSAWSVVDGSGGKKSVWKKKSVDGDDDAGEGWENARAVTKGCGGKEKG
jgi:hypothetical protein